MSGPNSDAAVCALVLAAGKSSRFGASKLVQPFRGKPLLQHALLAARAACRGSVYLTVGHDRRAVTAAAAGLYDRLVVNSDYSDGMGTSIAAAIRSCPEQTDAVIVTLADQPLVTADHLLNLRHAWSGDANEIVATAFDETHGPPILFGQQAFAVLSELSADQGPRFLLTDPDFVVRTVEFAPAGFDIDRPSDLCRLDQG